MKKKIILIDGHSILFRAFHGMPAMTGPNGICTNAVYGFLRILFKILDTENPDYLVVAFDTSAPTFRHKIYGDYKGTRKPAPPEFKEQQPLIREILTAMNIPIFSKEGWEADDILGTLAKRAQKDGMEAVIVSGDHDLLQIADEHIRISIPSTRGGKTENENYYAKDVLENYQVTPTQFIDVKALMGDTSDNIPGLPGVGKVTATKLIVSYGSIENAREHLTEIKPNKAMEAMRDHYDLAVLSKELATINTEAPIDVTWDECLIGNLYTLEVYNLFKELNFKSFYDRFEKPAEKEELFWKLISTKEELSALKEKAITAKKAGVALAYEKNFFGMAIAVENNIFVILPQPSLTENEIKNTLISMRESGVSFYACNIKEILEYIGSDDSKNTFDAVVAAYLINPLKADYDYDAIAMEYLHKSMSSKEELIGKKGWSGTKTPEKIQEVLAYSASVALESEKPLREKLEEMDMIKLFDEVEMPLTGVLAGMEMEGILVNPEELKAYGSGLTQRIDELTVSIYQQAGQEFNINSPKQLGEILFEKMQLPGGKKTKTGYSTAADVLEKLAADQPIVSDILEYRQLTKLKSTYADGLAAFIDADGRIRTTFNQTITATGRLSSTDPNLQNIPMRMEMGRKIRKCFIPKEGCVFVDADYSQIELRILAHMSRDEELITAYREARDIHRITASQVFHTPFEEVTDQQRRNAKAVNFGIIYGISSFGLSQDLSITKKEAEQYIKNYFAAYPSIHAYLQGMVESAKEKGYAVSLFNRRRPIPELKESNFMRRSFGERVAMNSPIQGTAADIMKIAMIRVAKRMKEEKLSSRLILQIHDELLIEAPENEAEKVSHILQEEMAAAADLSVKLETDCHTGKDWYEAK